MIDSYFSFESGKVWVNLGQFLEIETNENYSKKLNNVRGNYDFKRSVNHLLFNLDESLLYIDKSSIVNKSDIKLKLQKEAINYLIESTKVKTDIRNLKNDRDFKEVVGVDNWIDVFNSCIDRLVNIKRDDDSKLILSSDMKDVVKKYLIICSYKASFSTIRARISKIRKLVDNNPQIAKDTKDKFLKYFNFDSSLTFNINSRTNERATQNIENKIIIDKSKFENMIKSLGEKIDSFKIKLDSNNEFVSAKSYEKKHKEIKIDNKMETITILSMYIIACTGRRLSELLTIPTNYEDRIKKYSENIEGFGEVNTDYKEILLCQKNVNTAEVKNVIFLNQKKMRKGDNIKAYMIPIKGSYIRLIQAIKLLRALLPTTVIRKSDIELANYLRGYFAGGSNVKSWDDFVKEYNLTKESDIRLNRKDFRGIYAVYMKEFNNEKDDTYIGKLLHGAKAQNIKDNSYKYYNRFELV